MQCSSNDFDVIEVFTDSLDPFTVQCVAVYENTDGIGNDVTDCRYVVYHSKPIQGKSHIMPLFSWIFLS